MYAPTTSPFGLPDYTAAGAAALKHMDRSRQARGRLFEQAGYGPRESPHTVLHREPGLNLRRYDGQADAGAPAALLVPAPIKRSYIWDLAPEVSVVRRWIDAGYRVYLAEWTPLPEDGPDLGLADYGSRLLAACQQAIEADSAEGTLTVAGHSLGGILAAIYGCLHPDRVRATVLLESPLHFGGAASPFRALVEATPDAGRVAAAFGQVPGVFLNLMSALAEPRAFQWERMADRWLSLGSAERLATHMRVERWTHDEFALPGRLFTELVEDLYRRDAFMRGELEIDGRRIGPQALRAPLLGVVDPRSRLIPVAALARFHDAAASTHKCLLHYGGDVGVNLQHVGVLVGASAHGELWPAIFRWLEAHRD
ncbi:alpha/beta fold hydrolase [Massilia oculi]|uniref:Alpha/beta fold hydrolase n=1 Tax=Massilia hydrophila TaxID=3044279 RepID=A0ABS7YB89_9BURK|nr:alpha/beta fold hydrolase [Massilia oculi]MCA1855620.1 alpha/beta fold hydrolase [Massilia oculi]